MNGELPAGWGWPLAARKAHWFDAGSNTSLCGRWMCLGPRDGDAVAVSYDDCAMCTKRLAKRAEETIYHEQAGRLCHNPLDCDLVPIWALTIEAALERLSQ